MFGLGFPEIIVILAVALIVLGPKRLPELAQSLGKALKEFRKATSEVRDGIEKDIRSSRDEPQQSPPAPEIQSLLDKAPSPPRKNGHDT
jgi:TatA/E family protein of Tat protein translocase